MPNQPDPYSKISVQSLKGLNERIGADNPEVGEFDTLKGWVTFNDGSLRKIEGIELLQTLDAPIYNLCQTNDSSGNIIIQTRDAIIVMNETEFFNQTPYSPTLTPIAITEEEDMSYCLLAHTEAEATHGGTSTTSLVQRKITEIVTQVDAAGDAVAFCSLAANQFTLAVGVYRISGWVMGAGALADEFFGRLENISTGAVWSGAANEYFQGHATVANKNVRMFFEGVVEVIGAPATFEIKQAASAGNADDGFGVANDITGLREVYAMIKILKTA